jgi:hypothetical protein
MRLPLTIDSGHSHGSIDGVFGASDAASNPGLRAGPRLRRCTLTQLLIVYDFATWAFIYNSVDRMGLSSYVVPNMERNADGSVDVYFGPTAPKGLESNWSLRAPYALLPYLVSKFWKRESFRNGSQIGFILRSCAVTALGRLNNPSRISIARSFSPRIA